MPRPTSATTLQRPDLGVLAYEHMANSAEFGFIGLEVMPVFDTPEQSADYPILPLEALLEMPEVQRAARAAYSRGDYEFETGTYSCKEYGREEPVDDSEVALYRRYFDAEQVAVTRATDIILRQHEARVAAKAQSTSVAGGNAAITTPWSTAATCTPRADMETGKLAMRDTYGIMPNAAAMNFKVFTKVMNSAEIKDAFKYTNPVELGGMEVQKRLLAQYFGLEKILVGGAIKNTAKKGQNAAVGNIWTQNYVSLLRVSDGGADLREPCFGRTFLWTGDSPDILVTESYRDESIRSNVYRVRQNTDEAVQFAGALYILTNASA